MLLLVLLVFTAVFITVFVAGKQRNQGAVYSRLKEMAMQGERPDARQAELSQPLRYRVLQPLINKTASKFSAALPQERLQRIGRRLEQAGMNFQAAEWLAFKWIASVILGSIVLLFSMAAGKEVAQAVFAAAAMIIFAAVLGEWQLANKIAARKKKIIRELPDVLDLLTISVEAGLGFDGAMSKVAEKGKGNLSAEFRRVLKEMEIGMSRQDALKEMSRRLDVEAVKTLVNSLLQADQLGLGMAKVLRNQGMLVRLARKQTAEESAMKAPVKMLFPLVFFIFPTIFIVLLGPAVLQIIEVFTEGVLP